MSKWLKRLAILSILIFPLAVIGSRLGLFNVKLGLASVGLSFILAIIVFLVSVFITLKHKNDNPMSAKTARSAMIISLLPILVLASIIVGGRDIPQIHNISTDVTDPPQFYKITSIRTDQDNPLEYDIAAIAEVQQVAYPKVKTLSVTMSRNAAQQRAASIAEALGWNIIDNNSELGVIEASDTTKLWAFTDDIVIRLRGNQSDDQVAIDLRSVSRVGRSDMGANAQRIEAFITAFNANP